MFNKISLIQNWFGSCFPFVNYLVVHVFPARMREMVYSVLMTASVEGSVAITVIVTDGADARQIFYRIT